MRPCPPTPQPSVIRILRGKDAFSLLELLIVVAAISSVATVAILNFSGSGNSVKAVKLQQDVAALNRAVRAYVLSGGDIPATATGPSVIAKLKTVASSTSRSKIAGLRNSMIDPRLLGITSSDASTMKAVWDNSKKSFILKSDGSGFREFVLDNSVAPTAAIGEERSTVLALDNSNKWIWNYAENESSAAAPRQGAISTHSPVSAPASGGAIQVLQAPTFSKPGALYNDSDFNPDLKVSLINPNPSNTADTYYSISNGAWLRWDGTPLSIPQALATEVRAYSAPLDPDRYEESAVSTALYETIFFSGTSTGVFKNPKGDPGLVSNLLGPLTGPLFTFGSPAVQSGFTQPNSLSFTGRSFSSIAPDQFFELGSLSYYNGSTYSGTNATSVQLTVNLSFTTPGVTETLPFTFQLLSTPNTKEDKKNDWRNKQTEKQMDDDDADYVYIPEVSTKFSTTIKGQTFYLVLSFGSNNGNGFTTIDEFHTHENKTMTGTIFGKFTTTPPN
ncbi:MAG: hypothetical protein JWL81_1443 [Verrucomicrobiales bacterium]|nr:hypothetical protein [Verrucomicrobiales bacterium]